MTDHVCWPYDDVRDFLDAGVAYLADGHRAGQRLMYVSTRTAKQMRRDLAPLTAADRLLDDGGLALATLAELFGPALPGAPEQRMATMRAATERAVADGYVGLRVLADVTELVADARRRADQVLWEHLADRYMGAGNPMTAFCGYNREVVGESTVSDVAAVHPLVHGPESIAAARVFFDGDRLVVAGTLDAFNCRQVYRLLAASPAGTGQVMLYLGELEFIDARGLFTLFAWGRELAARGGGLRLTAAPDQVLRMWRILGFDCPGVTIDGGTG